MEDADQKRRIHRIRGKNARGEYQLVDDQLGQILRRLESLASGENEDVHDPIMDQLLIPAVRSAKLKVGKRIKEITRAVGE